MKRKRRLIIRRGRCAVEDCREKGYGSFVIDVRVPFGVAAVWATNPRKAQIIVCRAHYDGATEEGLAAVVYNPVSAQIVGR